jgi:hypothetical protein
MLTRFHIHHHNQYQISNNIIIKLYYTTDIINFVEETALQS